MAHFAQIENGIVKQVIVVGNEDITSDGVEIEALGIAFCQKLLGQDTEWVQTSYSGKIRHKYAGIGDTYDSVNDVFISPQPYDSWTLNYNFDWEAPFEMPTDGMYKWDEEQIAWVKI